MRLPLMVAVISMIFVSSVAAAAPSQEQRPWHFVATFAAINPYSAAAWASQIGPFVTLEQCTVVRNDWLKKNGGPGNATMCWQY